MMKTNVEFFIGEVVEAAVGETYTDTDSDSLYTILVKTYNDYNPQRIYCRPANINIKQIPLIGEHVFIYRSIGVE